MKELKFRVWDGECMIYNACVGGFSDNPPTRPTVWSEVDSCWINVEPLPNIYDGVMQYTGLKDKNDKDIYEADLVKVGHYQTHYITVQDFHGYRFMWGLDQLTRSIGIDGEIIGNIYELNKKACLNHKAIIAVDSERT